MSKLIVSEFTTIYGIVEAPEIWFPEFKRPKVQESKDHVLQSASTIIIGRNTYETLVPVWNQGNDLQAVAIDRKEKFVVDTKPLIAQCRNITTVSSDICDHIKAMKDSDGKDILVFGSAELVELLIQEKLVDKIRLLISPIVLGCGNKLFSSQSTTRRFITTSSISLGLNTLLTYNGQS